MASRRSSSLFLSAFRPLVRQNLLPASSTTQKWGFSLHPSPPLFSRRSLSDDHSINYHLPPIRSHLFLRQRNAWPPRIIHPFVNPIEFSPSTSVHRSLLLDDEEEEDDRDHVEAVRGHVHQHDDGCVSVRGAHRLLRLAQVESIRQRLEMEKQESMAYSDFLHMCLSDGVASSLKDAKFITQMLDDAGVVLIFRDLVYLKPKQVAQLVMDAIPKPLPSAKRQSLLHEVSVLEQKKKEIDLRAQKHSRRVLWLGFGYITIQTALIFRLTFWELSWDVMEPIAYFATTFNLLVGYAFFLVTSREPTYQDIGRTLFSSKQQKLIKKRNLDIARLCHLKQQCHPFNLA